eukprot:285737_1
MADHFCLGKLENIITLHPPTNHHSTKPKRKQSFIPILKKMIYESIFYSGTMYKTGDDVVVNRNGEKSIARITDIYLYSSDPTMPKLGMMYYYTKLESKTEDDTVQTRDHEILIDERTSLSETNIESLVGKALVVASSEQYLEENQRRENEYQYLYHDIYYCTHSIDPQTNKKQLLPPSAIAGTPIASISHVNPNCNKINRKRDFRTIIDEALRDASIALRLSEVPEHLKGREEEREEIERFMKQQIMNSGQGSGLYISGMPGTGKTAMVRQIAVTLQKIHTTNDLPEFDFIEINAMKLPTPRHIYTELATQLLGEHLDPDTAVRKLVNFFSTKNESRAVIVLLVDELDFLLTRRQKVIYNLFDWPTKRESKLVVIGIANTMDLPERLLPRVSSRLGTQRVVFKSYARHQLTEIIEQRLESTKVFSADAIRFCASAVAGVSGDCRTALQICRRAVEIAQKDVAQNGIAQLGQRDNHNTKRVKTRSKNKRGKAKCDWENDYGEEIVTLQHLKSAKDAFDQTNDIQIVSMCSIYEKLFLTAIVMCNTRSDGFAGMTRKYRQKFDNFVQTRLGDSKMGNVHFRNMVDRLEDVGILKIDFEKNDWKEFITFNVKMDEAMHALKENDVCAKILSTLQAV